MEAGVEDGSPGGEPQRHLISGDSGAEAGGEGEAVGGAEGAAHVRHHQLGHSPHQGVDALVEAEGLGPVATGDAHGEQLRCRGEGGRKGGGLGQDNLDE